MTVARLDRSSRRTGSPIFYDDLAAEPTTDLAAESAADLAAGPTADPAAEPLAGSDAGSDAGLDAGGGRRVAEVSDAAAGRGEGAVRTVAAGPDLTDPGGTDVSPTREQGKAEPTKRKRRKQGSFWGELPVLIGVALILALVIKAFVVQAFYIPSQSMENTLKVGDRVLVNKFVYHLRPIHRGDVVVFSGVGSWDPQSGDSHSTSLVSRALESVSGFFGLGSDEKDYIKRVIGVAGDHVQCAGKGAPVLVNGHPLDERSYLHQGNSPSTLPFDVTVPRGRIWVMGDHRDVSADSRYHRGEPGGGTIPTNKVVGRAFVIAWPISRWKSLSVPATFDQPALADAGMSSAPLALGFAAATPLAFLYRRSRRRP